MKEAALFLRAVVAIVLVGLSAPSSSRATLISLDLRTPGDGLLTRDTESGLEWLDLDQSAGYSYNQIAAGAGGFTDLGFRHATLDEVFALTQEFGFPPGGAQPPFLNAVRFIQTMSCTTDCLVDGWGSAGIAEPVPLNSSAKVMIQVRAYIDPPPPFGFFRVEGRSPQTAHVTIGHFLVRAVPELRFTLLVLAIGAVFVLRRWSQTDPYTDMVLSPAVYRSRDRARSGRTRASASA